MNRNSVKDLLEKKFHQFNNPSFIPEDPISIPHGFSKKQDIEISGLFAAVLAWGRRSTIISKCNELMGMMDNSPYDFILNHRESDLKTLMAFKHRTFNDTDLLYFVHWLNNHYSQSNSLETAFVPAKLDEMENTESAIDHFYNTFFSLPDYPERTKKHIQSPLKKSACKRINMFLRWMVRNDNRGVDFGIWNSIKPDQLLCPLDLHVDRVARNLGLISRKQTDWFTTLELTENLKKMDPIDPVKYDFALFGLGVLENY